MDIVGTAKTLQALAKDHAPTILTALGVSGTIGTAYLTGKASWVASHRVQKMTYEYNQVESPPDISTKEILLEVWDLYIPPVIAGGLTIGAIICSNHISSKRMAAAYSLLAMSQKQLSDYQEKAVELLGPKKEKSLRDEIAEDKVKKNPPPAVVGIGTGPVLCCELYTGRYFNSDMEALNRAKNKINSVINSQRYALLCEFYDEVGLAHTSVSSSVGWEQKLMDLDIGVVMTDDGRPCLAFDYNYINPL